MSQRPQHGPDIFPYNRTSRFPLPGLVSYKWFLWQPYITLRQPIVTIHIHVRPFGKSKPHQIWKVVAGGMSNTFSNKKSNKLFLQEVLYLLPWLDLVSMHHKHLSNWKLAAKQITTRHFDNPTTWWNTEIPNQFIMLNRMIVINTCMHSDFFLFIPMKWNK